MYAPGGNVRRTTLVVRFAAVREVVRATAAALILHVAAIGIAHAEDVVQGARGFLTGSQVPTGTFPGAPVVDTIEAIRALTASPARDAAAAALFLSRPDNSEAAFARLAALAASPYADPIATQAAEDLVRSGALGLGPGHAANDPIVLAAALRFAVGDAALTGCPDFLVSALAALIHADGSFGFVDNDGDLAATAEILRALDAAPGVGAAGTLASQARAFLTTAATNDPSALPSSDVALLLLSVRANDAALVLSLANQLALRQGVDGSFDQGDIRATALSVQALTRALPDLRIRRPTVDLTEPVTGEPLVRTVLVSNAGLVASPPTRVDFDLIGGGGAVTFSGSSAIAAVAPGQTISVNLDCGVQGSPGGLTLQATVNPDAEFSEGELDLNVLTFGYRVSDLADLVLTVSDVSVSPAPPLLHESNRVTVRLRNVGEATAHDVLIQLFEGDPGAGGTLLREMLVGAVAAGTPRTLTAELIPRTTAAVPLVARADPAGTVRESDETNNTAVLEVTPVNPAELVVDLRPSVSTSTPSVPQGEPASVTYNVVGSVERFGNQYPDASLWPFDGVVAAVYDGTPGAGGVELDRQRVYPWINCDRWGCYGVHSSYVEVFLPEGVVPGVHHVTVVTDPDHEIPDGDRSNDAVMVDIEIVNPGLPDLRVSSMEADRHRVASGRPSTITARIVNGGVSPALNVPYSITFPARVVQGEVPLIEQGQTHEIVQEVQYEDLTPTAYGVTLRIDPENVIEETTKTNNSASVLMSQGVGDMQIDSVAQTVDPAPAGPPVPVEILVRNDSISGCNVWWVTVKDSGGSYLGMAYQTDSLAAMPSGT
jgi:hypothetical protein